MTDLVDVKLLLLRELMAALEAERDEKIVMWEAESIGGMAFHTLRFSLDDGRMALIDAALNEAYRPL